MKYTDEIAIAEMANKAAIEAAKKHKEEEEVIIATSSNKKENSKKTTFFEKVVIVIFFAAIIVAIFAIGETYGKKNTLIQVDEIIKVATPGDGIISLAGSYCPKGMDIRIFVDIIEKYNDLDNASLDIGQAIKIPVLKTLSEIVSE